MATPYGPPRERRHGSVIGPLVLIFIGGVFLLQNAGLVPPTVWGNLWRLWPLVLILAGLDILFGRRAPALVALLGLCAIVLALGIAAGINFRMGPAAPVSAPQTFSTEVNGANQTSVVVRFGAGQLLMHPLTETQPGQLASMTYSGPGDLIVEPSYSVSSGTGRLEYSLSGRGQTFPPIFETDRPDAPHMDIGLSPGVPISTLNVQTGASTVTIDLSGLQVNNLDMAVGASTTRLRLPDSGATVAHISGGAATINLEIPPGVSAQIRQRGGLSTVTVDQNRFPQVGDDLYRSPDWDVASNKADITIETGVTTIQVN
jgi:hypothetical protein